MFYTCRHRPPHILRRSFHGVKGCMGNHTHIKSVLYTLPHGNEASQDHQAPKNTASESNKTSDRALGEIEQATTNRTFPALSHGSNEEPLESHPEEQLLSAEEELPESSSSECKVGPGTSSEYKVLSVE